MSPKGFVSMSKKILVVDDEKIIVKGLKYGLEQDNMIVDVAYDGEEAIEKIRENEYSLVLLDLMLPKFSGMEVCQQVREFSDVPIIMLTAKGEDMDKILGLESGADDYITKPFNILEVKARIKVIIRRYENAARVQTVPNRKLFVEGGMRFDRENRSLSIHEREINLTAKEYDLLDLFVSNPGKVYSRDQLLKLVWGEDYPGDVRTVDVHVRRLREKIEENPSDPKYVQTKWGVGYFYKLK